MDLEARPLFHLASPSPQPVQLAKKINHRILVLLRNPKKEDSIKYRPRKKKSHRLLRKSIMLKDPKMMHFPQPNSDLQMIAQTQLQTPQISRSKKSRKSRHQRLLRRQPPRPSRGTGSCWRVSPISRSNHTAPSDVKATLNSVRKRIRLSRRAKECHFPSWSELSSSLKSQRVKILGPSS